MNFFPLTVVALLSAVDISVAESPIVIVEPAQDRWMYPSNSTPGTRAQASTFSALPASAGLDDRWGFFLFAFDTGSALPAGLPPEIYQIHSVKVSATIGQNELFRYDPTADPWETFGTPSVPASVPDADLGRPLELHGAGFRGAWTPLTFLETSPYGSSVPGKRNAYPLGYDAAGTARDVSNNVTQQFDSTPWALGKNDTLAAGDLAPIDTTFDFEIDSSLPGVSEYLRQGLSTGRVWFSLSSLHPATQQAGEFVAYYTRDDLYHQLFGGLAPQLTLTASVKIPLTIERSGSQVTVTWQEFAGFTHTLQSSTDMSSGSWLPVHTHAAAVNGSGVFSENLTTSRRFFRLALTSTPTP